MKPQRHRAVLLLLTVSLLLAVPLAVGVGSVPIPVALTLKTLLARLGWADPGLLAQKEAAIILMIRLPRVLAAMLVGASLALAGAVMQGLFRNPLASPEILGVSAGGSLGAVAAITSGLFAANLYLLPLCTVTGAALSAGLIYRLSTYRGATSLLFVVLAGMALSSFLNGLISALLLFSREYEISQFIFWTMGGLDGRRWEHLGLAAPLLLPGLALLCLFAKPLNLLLMGEESAHALGLNLEWTKRAILGLAALVTGVAVSISGTIGFVGLLVPHLMRLLVGSDHRILMPASALGGALFLLLCDLAGRAILPPLDIRVGIITSLVGSPYLLYLLFTAQRKKSHGAVL